MKNVLSNFVLLTILFLTPLFSSSSVEANVSKLSYENIFLNNSNIFLKEIKQRRELELLNKELKSLRKSMSNNKEETLDIEDRKHIIESRIQVLSLKHQDIYKNITKITVANEPYNIFNFFSKKPLKEADYAIKKLMKIQEQYQVALSGIKEYIKKTKDKIEITEGYKLKKRYKNNYIVALNDKRFVEGFKTLLEQQYEHLLEQRNSIGKDYFDYRDNVIIKHLVALSIIILTFMIAFFLKRVVNRYIKEDDRQFMYNRTISSAAAFIILAIILINYSENIIYSLTVLTFIGAAIIIATREFSLNIVAWVYINIGSSIKVGDRVLIPHETKYYYGDIINISPIKITLLEAYDFSSTKEAINAGRIIFIPNSYIFSHAIISYNHQSNTMVYDYMTINFTLDSNLQNAEQIVNEVLKEETELYFESAKQEFIQLKKRYDIKQRTIEPEVQFSMNTTSTAIKMTIWYMAPIKKLGYVKNRILQALIRRVNSTENVYFSKKTKTIKESNEDVSES